MKSDERLDLDEAPAAEAAAFRARVLDPTPARCGKCGALTPPVYLAAGEGRCPECLAAEVAANRAAVTAEFDRLLRVEALYRELAAQQAERG